MTGGSKPRSISRRLTTMNMLVSGTAVLLACIAFSAYEIAGFRQSMINDLSIQAQIIGSNAVSTLIFNDPQSAEKTLAALHASPHVIYAGVYTPSGQLFAGYRRDGKDQNEPGPALQPTQAQSYEFSASDFRLIQPIVFEGKTVGLVYIRSDLGALMDRIRTYLVLLSLILVASLLAALLLSRISQKTISQPMMHLAETARIISRDKNYGVRAAEIGDHDEVRTLVDAFNDMLTAIQQRDTTLQESEEQFRTLADSVPQLAWIAEADGAIVWYNQRWYDFTGTTPDQMRGWGWQSVHDPNVLPDVLVKWRASINTAQRFEMVFPLRGRDGTYRDFLTMVVPVVDARGKVVRWFGTNTDITEQRRSEEALRRSEKLAATGRLAASIAHEVNNPLEAVTNLLYLAKKQPSKAQTYLAMADEELDRIAEITRHTLGFYRDTSSPQRVSIPEVMRGLLVLYHRKIQFKKIVMKERYGEGIDILGFPGEIRQIFANLLVNAIEAMGEGGTLVIKATQKREWGGSRRNGVRISVMDNGCGIDRALIAKIFDPFYTTKKDVGTGLGLWLTQSLVVKHQGQIRVRSRTDAARSGTVFTIFFPDTAFREDTPVPDNDRQTEVQSSNADA